MLQVKRWILFIILAVSVLTIAIGAQEENEEIVAPAEPEAILTATPEGEMALTTTPEAEGAEDKSRDARNRPEREEPREVETVRPSEKRRGSAQPSAEIDVTLGA